MDKEATSKALLSMMRENHGGEWPGATPIGVVNQTTDLENEPFCQIVEYGAGDWGVRVSTYQWLLHFLTLDVRLTKLYQRWENKHAARGYGQYAMYDFFEWYKARRKDLRLELDGVHYTYNWENTFSQDFQYAEITADGLGTWVLLQTHNGVDARDGLADIQIFVLRPYSKDDFPLASYIEVSCGNGHEWRSEGYNFYSSSDKTNAMPKLPRRADTENKGVKRKKGRLWMDEKGVLYCPLCHKRNPLSAHVFV